MTHEHPHTPAKAPPAEQPRARRFKKRYALAAVSALASLGLYNVGRFCVPLFEGTQLCVELRLVHLPPPDDARQLGPCGAEQLDSNALLNGEEVVCSPSGWVRADGGSL